MWKLIPIATRPSNPAITFYSCQNRSNPPGRQSQKFFNTGQQKLDYDVPNGDTSMSLTARELGRLWFEVVWNRGRRGAIAELLSPNVVLHDAGEDSVGIEPFLLFFDRMQDTFSDIHVDVEEILAESDKACIRWTCRARHTGFGFTVPPTGAEVRITGISMIQVEEGNVVEAWQNWDMLGMMEQIKGHSAPPTYITA
jgi:predicted ester cyclase